MHPLFPTAEFSVIIQDFDINFGMRFVENILKIYNAIFEQITSNEDEIFH